MRDEWWPILAVVQAVLSTLLFDGTLSPFSTSFPRFVFGGLFGCWAVIYALIAAAKCRQRFSDRRPTDRTTPANGPSSR